MIDMQPSFFQWRKKVNGALALDPKRVTLSFTAADGRVYSIEPEELQEPRPGTYTARITDGAGNVQEVTSDFDSAPADRLFRRPPEDAIIARYERMAEDMDRLRRAAEARAQTAEADKFAALELVGGQQKRIFDLEQQVLELESIADPLFDDDTAKLMLQLMDAWSGAAELREQVHHLIVAIEKEPRAAERIARHAPQLIADLVRHLQGNEKE